ncbi:Bifunctional adenosylcobalamin biosynthesis protein [Candidatus Desulfarcum epimagneticum]|uniref:Adenosylcobinamide kinase n=1 Tax=uncultured Desulfobacteraceae bacterium TaxID=218296 RepID=A0A484HNE0_9BACT|nr:Bifunctional adenosylcobalamin biosynthesis protein [uncultured Desulfobacteraceae bacterium]
MPPHLTLITGGCKSGKSARALQIADGLEKEDGADLEKIFIATCRAADDEMRQRVAAHQKERGPLWKTLEIDVALFEAIDGRDRPGAVTLVDCLTLWVNNLLMEEAGEAVMGRRVRDFLDRLKAPKGRIILVTNEVGSGIVPANPLARRFRDMAGTLNQAAAALAHDVIWMVSGVPVKIK